MVQPSRSNQQQQQEDQHHHLLLIEEPTGDEKPLLTTTGCRSSNSITLEHHRNNILVFSRTISTFSRTPDLHPDHAQSLLGSTQIKLTTLATSNMATCWNRSSTSCLFTDQRPLPQSRPKPSDLNSNAIMFTTCT
ncbi:hypothetical protein LXL04_008391 [Taraxacum kok-saghyz]